MKFSFRQSNPDWNLDEDVSWRSVIRPYLIFSIAFPLFAVLVNSNAEVALSRTGYSIIWMFLFSSLLGTGLINSYTRIWYRTFGKRISFLNFPLFALLINLIWVLGLWKISGLLGGIIDIPIFKESNVRNLFRLTTGNGLGYIVFAWLRNRERFGKLKLQHADLRIQNLMAQFEILKQQLNPHFLFNALSTLRSMIREGNALSEEYVVKLSEILRESLQHNENDTVSLEEELRLLSAYRFLLSARFETGLNIRLEIPDPLLRRKVPAFALQLLLENCIKHNVVSEKKPLTVHIFAPDEGHLVIANNLQKKQSQAAHSGYGLTNLRARYQLLGIAQGMEVVATDDLFSVQLTLIEP